MYETLGSGPQAEKCNEPDWEQMYAKRKKEFDAIGIFKLQLLDFIKIVGIHSLRRDGKNQMAEFLGTIEIDLMQRNQELERLAAKIEK